MFAKSSTLVVPVELQALVVNEAFRNAEVRRWRMNFFQLQRHADPTPLPFHGEIEDDFCGQEHNRGVYLHWFVPKALRRGKAKAGVPGIAFDALPNRWMVVRTPTGNASPAATDVKAWLIASDALGASDDTQRKTVGGSTFAYVDKAGAVRVTRLGMSKPLPVSYAPTPETSSFRSRGAQFPTSLNALGMGEATFLAYQPLVNDVFSFHDPLDGVSAGAKLSYMVAGWYSDAADEALRADPPADPAADPAKVKARLAELAAQDEVLGRVATLQQLASRRRGAYVEARLAELAWQVKGGGEDATLERLATLSCTVYHGALHGLDRAKAAPPAKEQVSGPRLAVGHDAVDAWTALVKKANDQAPESSRLPSRTLALLSALQQGVVGALDEPGSMSRLDQVARASRFAAHPDGTRWVIERRKDPTATQTGAVDKATLTNLKALNDKQAEHDRVRREKQALQRELYDTWWQLELQKNAASQGSERDAVTNAIAGLTAGPLAKEIAAKQAFMTKFQTEDRGIVDPLKTAIEAQLTATPFALTAEVRDVFCEPRDPTLLITGIRPPAPFKADSALECLPGGALRASATTFPSLANDEVLQALVADFAADLATPPSQRAWKQPWNPLFVEWEVEWFPLPHDAWKLTGSDYGLDRTTEQLEIAGLSRARGHVLRGRNFLIEQNNHLFADRMKQLVEATPETDREKWKPLQALVDAITQHGYLSQPLKDFDKLLLMRSTQAAMLPEDKVLRDLVGDDQPSQPAAWGGLSPVHQGLREGQLKINKLLVYDGFGQCVRIVGGLDEKRELYQDPAKGPDLTPALGRTVMPLEPRRFVELKPRILEPTRLRFDLEAAGDTVPDLRGDGDPLRGWVVYNRLDKGLLYFDGKGEHVGESRVVAGGLHSSLPAAADPDLAALAAVAKDANQFGALLELIDRSLWLVESGAEAQERQLAVWMGRPLAVVHATLQLEAVRPPRPSLPDTPDGGAGTYLPESLWPSKLRRQQQGFRSLPFGMRLGLVASRQDGLIGYVRNGRLHAVVKPPEEASGFVGYAADDNLEVGFESAVTLTLLLDPRAAVHARTGILPDVAVRLPADRVAEAIARMAVRFRFLSLLTTVEKGVEAGTVDRFTLPFPAVRAGAWQWEETKAGTSRRFDVQDTAPWDDATWRPALLRDGRLVLTGLREPKNT